MKHCPALSELQHNALQSLQKSAIGHFRIVQEEIDLVARLHSI